MAVKFLEAGSSATYGLEFWDVFTTPGSWSSDSTVTRTGPRSNKYVRNAGGCMGRKNSILQAAGNRIVISYRFDALPDANNASFLTCGKATGEDVVRLSLETSGKLALYNDTGGLLITGSATLGINTWYRISLSYTVTSTTVNRIKVYVNGGTADIDATNLTLTAAVVDNLIVGANHASGPFGNAEWVDSCYVDDGTDLADPGDIRVAAKLPAAVNENNFDTPIGDGTVNNRPIDETKGMQQAGSGQVNQSYTLQAADAGDLTIGGNTLVARSSWLWGKGAAGGAGPAILDNGSTHTITTTSTSALYTFLTDSASYPSNAQGIGMRSSGTADDTFLYECGTLIAFIGAPTSAPAVTTLMGAILM